MGGRDGGKKGEETNLSRVNTTSPKISCSIIYCDKTCSHLLGKHPLRMAIINNAYFLVYYVMN